MLEDLTPHDRRTSCKVREVIETLEPTDQDILKKYLQDWDNWSSNGLSKGLASKGIRISANTIMKHRTGTCSC